MMRKVFSVSLMAAVAVLGLALSANAGITVDVQFVNQTAPTGITIAPGDAGPGCTFTGYYHRTVATGYCMDVMLKTDELMLGLASRVGYDSDNGLDVASFYEWIGVGVSWNAKGTLQKSCAPMDGVTDNGVEVGKFDCAVPLPSPPGLISPGTYRIGTIVWDTSATTAGTEGINILLTGVGAYINGNIISYAPETIVGAHILNIIPEPGTASLLGLGLVGLILAGRRSRA